MSNNKQSSVEWLFEQIKNHIDAEDGSMGMNWLHDGTFEQAKAMHEEETIDFGNDLLAQNDTNYTGFPNLAEQHYNETFGGNK